MAFKSTNFTPNGIVTGVHSYKTNDTVAAMLAAGYFLPVAGSLTNGNKIYVTTSTILDTSDTTRIQSIHKVSLQVSDAVSGTAIIS